MKTVVFQFDIKQKVITKLGDVGLISTLGVNQYDKNIYYVDLPGGKGSWEDECDLKLFE